MSDALSEQIIRRLEQAIERKDEQIAQLLAIYNECSARVAKLQDFNASVAFRWRLREPVGPWIIVSEKLNIDDIEDRDNIEIEYLIPHRFEAAYAQ